MLQTTTTKVEGGLYVDRLHAGIVGVVSQHSEAAERALSSSLLSCPVTPYLRSIHSSSPSQPSRRGVTPVPSLQQHHASRQGSTADHLTVRLTPPCLNTLVTTGGVRGGSARIKQVEPNSGCRNRHTALFRVLTSGRNLRQARQRSDDRSRDCSICNSDSVFGAVDRLGVVCRHVARRCKGCAEVGGWQHSPYHYQHTACIRTRTHPVEGGCSVVVWECQAQALLAWNSE